jgi:hypothetical protein
VRDLGMVNGLAALARELSGDRIAQLSINPNDVAIDAEDGSDIYWNQAGVDALVARWQAGPSGGAPAGGAAETARVQVLNGAEVQGVATRVSDYLGRKGFELSNPGDAERAYEHTTIIDYTGRPQTRRRLADALGIQPSYVLAQPGADAPAAPQGADIVVVVGRDYQAGWVEP